jgi:hypothetical protein
LFLHKKERIILRLCGGVSDQVGEVVMEGGVYCDRTDIKILGLQSTASWVTGPRDKLRISILRKEEDGNFIW